MLTSKLSAGSDEPGNIIKRLLHSYPMQYQLHAARALNDTGTESFTEADFKAKCIEVQRELKVIHAEAHKEMMAKVADKKARKAAADGKAVQNGEPVEENKVPVAKPGKKQKPQEKRAVIKKELEEILTSDLGMTAGEASGISEQARKFSYAHMLQTAHALRGPNSRQVTEADFIAKTAEMQGDEEQKLKAKTAERTAAKKARKAAKKAKDVTEKKAKEGKEKKRDFISKMANNYNAELQQIQRTADAVSEDLPDAPPEKTALPAGAGFSTEFWMDLAGSRAAAEIAAL